MIHQSERLREFKQPTGLDPLVVILFYMHSSKPLVLTSRKFPKLWKMKEGLAFPETKEKIIIILATWELN